MTQKQGKDALSDAAKADKNDFSGEGDKRVVIQLISFVQLFSGGRQEKQGMKSARVVSFGWRCLVGISIQKKKG